MCNHPFRTRALNVHVYIQDNHLQGGVPEHRTFKVEEITFCSHPSCEHITSLNWRKYGDNKNVRPSDSQERV